MIKNKHIYSCLNGKRKKRGFITKKNIAVFPKESLMDNKYFTLEPDIIHDLENNGISILKFVMGDIDNPYLSIEVSLVDFRNKAFSKIEERGFKKDRRSQFAFDYKKYLEYLTDKKHHTKQLTFI